MARPLMILQLFARSSRVQGKRAVLTIAAIAWGTLSLILMLSFGEGLRISLFRGSQGMGSNLAIMWPGETSVVWEGLPSGRPLKPKIDDLHAAGMRWLTLGFYGVGEKYDSYTQRNGRYQRLIQSLSYVLC